MMPEFRSAISQLQGKHLFVENVRRIFVEALHDDVCAYRLLVYNVHPYSVSLFSS